MHHHSDNSDPNPAHTRGCVILMAVFAALCIGVPSCIQAFQ